MTMLSIACAVAAGREASGAWPDDVSSRDLAYLRTLQRETWDYIDYFIDEATGFPHDNNSRQGKTNTTNLGMYLASLAMAYQLGYVDHKHAVARIERILDTLDRYEHWNRLYNNWLEPGGANLKAYDGPNNISDYNKLPAGLILVRQTFPSLADRCTAFLDEIPWEIFYEPSTGKMFYEFDVVDKSVRNAVYFYRGEDKILGHFLAIASGKVPPESWDRHDLSEEEKYGYRYFLHGWQGGGLFMQFICGLFLDDRGTKLGHSSVHFAWAQMVHALNIGSPIWGWSACVGPSEKYHGMGDIQDAIVTPHASALAIHLFPREVIDNLKRLEEYGLREPYEVDGRKRRFGFRDSVNWRTGAIADAYLILDQAMLFLALVNYCENGLVWNTFDRDPMIEQGKSAISEYRDRAKKRAEEQRYIRSLSYDVPGAMWRDGDTRGPKGEPGTPIQREIWMRSLSAEPISGYEQTWSVSDADGKIVRSGALPVELSPRASVKLPTVSVKTDSARRGTRWTLSGELRRAGGEVLRTHREDIFFHSYLPLRGTWKLRAGDDPSWREAGLDDAAWDKASVPERWEHGNLPDYDGLAWYRLRFRLPADRRADWGDKPLGILLGRIDDADVSYLNGAEIGRMGRFPPAKETAFSVPRLYSIDSALLKEDNVLAVRVADWGGFGGIWQGPLAIGPIEELKALATD